MTTSCRSLTSRRRWAAIGKRTRPAYNVSGGPTRRGGYHAVARPLPPAAARVPPLGVVSLQLGDAAGRWAERPLAAPGVPGRGAHPLRLAPGDRHSHIRAPTHVTGDVAQRRPGGHPVATD